MKTRIVCALAGILITSQAFALENLIQKHGCNNEVGDCPGDGWGAGGGGGEFTGNITINGPYDDRFWVSDDGEAAGYSDWTTFAKHASEAAGAQYKKFPKGQKPDFSNRPLVKGSTPKKFKDLLAQDMKDKAAKQAAADKAAADKAAADKAAAAAAAAAANKAAAVYTGPGISSKPAGGGMVAGARTKP